MKRKILLAVTIAALGVSLAGCTTVQGTPFTITACSPKAAPQIYQTCVTIAGSGRVVTSVKATYTIWRSHLDFPGHWSWMGYGAISGSTWGTSSPVWTYSGYALDSRQFTVGPLAVSYPVGKICSTLNEGNFGNSSVKAQACA